MKNNTVYDEQFKAMACLYHKDTIIDGLPLDWRWIKAQAIQESGLIASAVNSRTKAAGIMQIMPKTSAEIALKLHIQDDPLNPFIGIMMGAYHDRSMWRIFAKEEGIERLRFSLAAYNAGQGNIIAAQSLSPVKNIWADVSKYLHETTGTDNAHETIKYVQEIEGHYKWLTLR